MINTVRQLGNYVKPLVPRCFFVSAKQKHYIQRFIIRFTIDKRSVILLCIGTKNFLRKPISMLSSVAVYLSQLTKQDGWNELYVLVWSDAIQCTLQSALLHDYPIIKTHLPVIDDPRVVAWWCMYGCCSSQHCWAFQVVPELERWIMRQDAVSHRPVRFAVLQSPSNGVDRCPQSIVLMPIVWPELWLFEWDQTKSIRQTTCILFICRWSIWIRSQLQGPKPQRNTAPQMNFETSKSCKMDMSTASKDFSSKRYS